MTMIMVNINDIKARLSEYLNAVAGGERVVICKRNRPVAELRAIEERATTPRPFGPPRVSFEVPPSFFEPLPDDILDAFEGKPQPGAPRAAESTPAYGTSRRRKPRR